VLLKVLFSWLPLVVHVWKLVPLFRFLFTSHSCYVEVVVGELRLLLGLMFDVPVTQGSLLPYMLFGVQFAAAVSLLLHQSAGWTWFDGLHLVGCLSVLASLHFYACLLRYGFGWLCLFELS
jgi:hypothetical protein